MNREELLKEIKSRLLDVYGDRLKGVVLYGSEARGEAEDDSDYDFLVLLKGPIESYDELRKVIEILYDLQLDLFRPIHALPVNAEDFDSGKYALYRNIKNEGIYL